MKRIIVVSVILLVVVAAVVAGWWFLDRNPEWWTWAQEEFEKAVDELGLEGEEEESGLVASGFVEADRVSVATEFGGRITALHVGEGDEVSEGDLLVELDDSFHAAQIEVANADLAVAEAMLSQIKAGVQEETLAYARSVEEQAKVAQAAAGLAWQDAQAMVDKPQDLELAVVTAEAQVEVLEAQVRQAQAMADSAEVMRNLADKLVSLSGENPSPQALHEQEIAEKQLAEALTAVSQAEAAWEGTQKALAELQAQAANPLSLRAEANAAKAQYDVATVAVEVAQAQTAALEMGATSEQIATAEAQVASAQAALETLMVQRQKLVVEAPIPSLVVARPVHVGEVAAPGAPLMTLANLDSVTLTIYVPEAELGMVQIGAAASVTVDAYPDRVFAGTVTYIANEAEFTPKNVQTRDERASMVFAVRIQVPNPDHALKPGMPADALIPDAGQN
jgi:multidrug efflux pump subunit AcrA (membrane-fusion protein)